MNSSLVFFFFFSVNIDKINTRCYRSWKVLHFKSKKEKKKEKKTFGICFYYTLLFYFFSCKIRHCSFCVLYLLNLLKYILFFKYGLQKCKSSWGRKTSRLMCCGLALIQYFLSYKLTTLYPDAHFSPLYSDTTDLQIRVYL